MSSKTLPIVAALVVAGAAVELNSQRSSPDVETAIAVRQFNDPTAADRLRDHRTNREHKNVAWQVAFAAVTGLTVAAFVRRAAQRQRAAGTPTQNH